MIRGKTITIVVPCKNESAIIQGFIKRIPRYVDEVLIVDNNSTDDTAKRARQAGARVVTEHRSVDGIGYGFAHQTGIQKATGDYIVAMDGDDTYPVKKIAAIIAFMEKTHTDFVSCNRLPLFHAHAISKTRQLGILILNILVWLLYGYPIRDILSGMWIAKRTLLPKLDLKSGDWNFSPEIKLQAIKNPAVTFAEYHIDHFVRENEPSKQHIWKTGIGHALFITDTWVRERIASLRIVPLSQTKESYAK